MMHGTINIKDRYCPLIMPHSIGKYAGLLKKLAPMVYFLSVLGIGAQSYCESERSCYWMLEIHVKENSTKYWKILNDRFSSGQKQIQELVFPGGMAWYTLRLIRSSQSNGCWCSKNPIVVHEGYFSWLSSQTSVCHECIHNHRANFFKETVFICYSNLVMA